MSGYRRISWLAIAALLLVPCLAGCTKNPATGKSQLILISREQEIALGEEAAPQFEQEFDGRVANDQLQAYVQAVGRKVSDACERPMPYEFTLVRSDVPNAFALPGGKIFLTAGLMQRMTNERQLAAVLAHETGHVSALHNVAGMQRQMGAAVLVEIAGQIAGKEKADAAKAATQVVTSVATLKYSRDDEYQADDLGIRYMAKAGYNPYGMVELLTVLYKLAESEPGSLEELFQTHPLSSKRIQRAEDKVKDDYERFSRDAADPDQRHFQDMHGLLLKTLGR